MKGIQLCIFAIVCVCWPHHTILYMYFTQINYYNYLTAYHAPTSYEYLRTDRLHFL